METGLMFILLSSSILLHFAHTDRQLVFVQTPMDWTKAQAHCRQTYTDLVTVYDDQENQNMITLTGINNINVWIGLRHNFHNWRWSMGVPTHSINNHDAIWAPEQPDNFGGNQHCAQVAVIMGMGEGVFDRECTKPMNFICFDGNNPPNYILYDNMLKTWHDAQQYCRTNHDDLASVSDTGVLNILLDKIRVIIGKMAWIGLYRDPWSSWSDNNSTTFYNWESIPTIYSTDDYCGYMSVATGKWHAIHCSTSYPFFCYGEILPPPTSTVTAPKVTTPTATQEGQRKTVLKVKLQSGANLNNMEIQHQILEQMKNSLEQVGMANVTVKWRATTKPVTNQSVPLKCNQQHFVN